MRATDPRHLELLDYKTDSFLKTLEALKRGGPQAALKQHLEGIGTDRSQEELQRALDAVYRNGDLKRQWEQFFGDPSLLQLPGWVTTKRRIYLGDYPPERFVPGATDSVFFRYDQFLGGHYQNLPKMPGEEDVFYIYAHGHNPEAKYETRNGKKYAAILCGGKNVTAEELVPILDRLGYESGNIRMITCWAGGTGKQGTVQPFIDDLVRALGGRAQWVKGTEGALLITEKGGMLGSPVERTISSISNRRHPFGHFESPAAVDPFDMVQKEILRLDGSLDDMRTATWQPGAAVVASAPEAKPRQRATLYPTSMPRSIFEGDRLKLYFWPDGRVDSMGTGTRGSYTRNDDRLTVRLGGRTLELTIAPGGEELVSASGARFEMV